MLLHENRLMVLAIAHALETHKTISGDDVAAIFEGRQGPKVNGRDYHHPSFLEVADRYHNEALVAHRIVGPCRGAAACPGSWQSADGRDVEATAASSSLTPSSGRGRTAPTPGNRAGACPRRAARGCGRGLRPRWPVAEHRQPECATTRPPSSTAACRSRCAGPQPYR